MTDTGTENDLRQAVQRLTERVDALELSAGNGRLSIGVMSGNLDTTIAAFIIALGAVAYDMEVDMFFTFWATAALRDPKKSPPKASRQNKLTILSVSDLISHARSSSSRAGRSEVSFTVAVNG
jgi:hypothetical protein